MTQLGELQAKNVQEWFAFLNEYDTFLRGMIADEEEKLRALVSGSLPRIEHALSMAQANAKQVENLETRRELLQQKAGFQGLSFSQVLEQLPQQEAEEGRELFVRFERDVTEIKFRNEKSMDFARAHIREVNPDALKDDAPAMGGAVGSAYAKTKRAERTDERPPLLQTKI